MLTVFIKKQAKIFVRSDTIWKYKVAEVRFSLACEVIDYSLWTTRF